MPEIDILTHDRKILVRISHAEIRALDIELYTVCAVCKIAKANSSSNCYLCKSSKYSERKFTLRFEVHGLQPWQFIVHDNIVLDTIKV